MKFTFGIYTDICTHMANIHSRLKMYMHDLSMYSHSRTTDMFEDLHSCSNYIHAQRVDVHVLSKDALTYMMKV